ncbi:OmpP1/FadL family transporter [Sulfurospirillum sp. 1307]|jgi:long-chain fatty acid transport protein
MNTYTKALVLLGVGALSLNASGYRIPEQSSNSVALGAAYVANANGADASYYNPANMVWNDNASEMELAFTYINLPKVKYTDNRTSTYNGDSKQENFYVPTFHYVSPEVNNWRFGLSFVAPGGLSKRWDEAFSKTFSEEFTLKILELNPTAAYKVNDKFSIGFGLRGVYTDGIVKSDGAAPADLNLDGTNESYVNVKRDMTGDSIDFGYNLALSYKPIENLTLSTTYRSKVDLTVTGDAKLSNIVLSGLAPYGTVLGTYNGGASVTIPLPATLAIAAAYTFNKTTVELVLDRTYWSDYKNLDFNYDSDLTTGALATFDNVKPKNWKDVNAYRIGITHQYNDKLKLMAGFSIDKTPAPDATLGFELPDSDAYLYSAGLEYKVNDKMKLGFSYLFSDKDTRSVNNGTLDGTFTDSAAHLVTASLKYRF